MSLPNRLLNPEFATPNFIPDPDKEYYVSVYYTCSGWTYLMALVMSGNSRIDELIEYSKTETFKDECNKQNKHGLTALMLASRYSDCDSFEKTVEMLIPHSDCNLQDNNGWTALMFASRNSSNNSTEKTVEMLIPYSDCNIQDINGWTALMTASVFSNENSTEKTVKMLIPHTDCNLKNKEGFTALILACRYSKNSSEKTVYMLIPYTEIDYESFLITPYLSLIAKLLNKKNKELQRRLKERETFKECLKEGLNLEEAIITSYL